MIMPDKLTWRAHATGVALFAALVLSGCGTPGPPQPPSLNLPEAVTNLAAQRTGNQVTLAWTMPRRNTDKMILKTPMRVQVCRSQGPGACLPVTANLTFAPVAAGRFTEVLPAELASGASRPLRYFVEVRNRKGRSAGLSNAAVVLAGQAPAAVADLAAEVVKDGIVLRWKAAGSGNAIRLQRTLLTPPPATRRPGPMSAPPEPILEYLDIASDEGRALDESIVFGRTYEYRAQRVAGVEVDGKTLELAGDISAPVRIEARDVFPPAVPAGLAAVANPPANGEPASIDLSWQPDTEPDLAGYYVYRREAQTPWQRISGQQPVPSPAYHDALVQPGHTYTYGVSAVDQKGYESGRSADAEETVPQQ